MRTDPVLAAFDRAEEPLQAWFAAIASFVDYGPPSLAEVEALGALAQEAHDQVLDAAATQPDWGSGMRYTRYQR